MNQAKTCTICGETKPLDDFSRNKQAADGRQSQCKTCMSEYAAKYHARNREAIRARRAKHRTANPHRVWAGNARQRARQQGHDITVEPFTHEDLTKMYGNACWHCGGEFEELDHYPIPISRGGHHVIENCKPSCKPCNRKSWKEN